MQTTLSKAALLFAVGILGTGLSLTLDGRASQAQTCNPFGCSQPGGGACNPFGCPNPGAGPCTPFGCPPSPPGYGANTNPQRPSGQIIVVPGNGGSNNTGMGECMDRLMYQELRASSGPSRSGYYSFFQPQGISADTMRTAGLVNRGFGWEGNQPVVKVQVMDGRTAAASCR